MEPRPPQNPTVHIEDKEYVAKPAIRLPDGEVFQGDKGHGEISMEIILAGKKVVGATEGFVTSKGRFVSRLEAEKIAFKAGQIKVDMSIGLTSQELHDSK